MLTRPSRVPALLALGMVVAAVAGCTTPGAPTLDARPGAIDSGPGDAGMSLDGPASSDVPPAFDAPMSLDAPAATDVPAALDTPATDVPGALDTPATADARPTGSVTFGGSCTTGADCTSGVCWDFSDVDPFCFGRGCSIACTADMQCRDAASAAGAPTPGAASCTPSTGTCDLSGTGLVAIACA